MSKVVHEYKTVAHFLNIGGLTDQYVKSYQGFITKHKTWTPVLWTEKDIHKLLVKYNEDNYFYSLNSFINRYNFAKYLVLAEHGGWYLDLDIIWKSSLDNLIKDKLTDKGTVSKFPDMFIPVRSFPLQKKINHRMNDDNILYARKGLLFDLIKFAKNRKDIDWSKKYEPFGPVSLSMWIHSREDITRKYMYEEEIQEKGKYCLHLNSTNWKFN